MNFEFNACKLKYRGLTLPLPPVGKVPNEQKRTCREPAPLPFESDWTVGWTTRPRDALSHVVAFFFLHSVQSFFPIRFVSWDRVIGFHLSRKTW